MYFNHLTAGGSGDPHFRTFDGLSYTFNGIGEYLMLCADPDEQTAEDEFILQARTDTMRSCEWLPHSNQVEKTPCNCAGMIPFKLI